MKKLTGISLLFLFPLIAFGQVRNASETETRTQLDRLEKVYQENNNQKLLNIAQERGKKMSAEKAKAHQRAQAKNWPTKRVMNNGQVMELMRLDPKGKPVYYITDNTNAAVTTNTDHLHPGGVLGLNLTGQGMVSGGNSLLGMWDGGATRITHNEFTQTGGSVVVQSDGAATLSDHATHVAGTMVANGADLSARGMAYQARLDAYDWTSDESEMANAATLGMLVSNHSYGTLTGYYYNSTEDLWYWNGDEADSEDANFGLYSSTARLWDMVCNNAPYYLPVKSAGNDRGDYPSSSSYQIYSGGSWVSTTTFKEKDGGADGYDCISSYGNSKNILTVGAVSDISGGYSQPSDVVMSSFSGWGPTDDGRIKPDIVGNGVSLYSSSSSGDADYIYKSGTSMASPNVSGSLILLQQHYENLHGAGAFMRSATLKGLVIHTASEAGNNPGPDYKFGWGLFNAESAAQAISDDHAGNQTFITESTYIPARLDTFIVTTNGNPFTATLCWNDPAATAEYDLDNPNIKLVNDLNIRLVDGGTTYRPWILDPNNPDNAATKGINFRDNVEKIEATIGTGRNVLVIVEHAGTIVDGAQDYSLIISGASSVTEPAPLPVACTSTLNTYPYAQGFETGFGNWVQSTTDDLDFTRINTNTPSTSTGPNAANQGSYYIYLEATGASSGDQAILESPCFEVSALSNLTLSFDYHMYGADMGSLFLEYAVNEGQWVSLWTQAGDQGDVWHNNQSVDIPLDNGADNIKLRFRAMRGTQYTSDVALDDINLTAVYAPTSHSFTANATDTAVTQGQSATLYAQGAPSGAYNYVWFSDSSSSIPIHQGNPYVTPSLSTPTTYWVALDSAGIVGLKTSVTVTIIEQPTVYTNLSAVICQGNPYNFNGQMLTQPGTYYDTLVATSGADSVLILELSTNGQTLTGRIFATTRTPSGGYLLGGGIESVGGTKQLNFAYLSGSLAPDSLLTAWMQKGFNHYVIDVMALNDSQFVAGGRFTSYGASGSQGIQVLRYNGMPDWHFRSGTGVNGVVTSLDKTTDGRIVIAGNFTQYNGTPISNIAILNPDGTLDPSFDPGTSTNGTINSIKVLSTGDILISGGFSTVNGQTRVGVARLNPDGSLDAGFTTGSTGLRLESGGVGFALDIEELSSGQYLLAGVFGYYGNALRRFSRNLVRLNPDGSFDNSLNMGDGPRRAVSAVEVAPDGTYWLGGGFTMYNKQPYGKLVNIHPNGTPTAYPGGDINGNIMDMTLVGDELTIAGIMRSYGETETGNLGALNISTMAYTALTCAPTGGGRTAEDPTPWWELVQSEYGQPQVAPPAQVRLFPNPSSGLFTLSTGTTDAVTVQVFGLRGELIQQQQVTAQGTIDLRTQPKGIYMVRLSNHAHHSTHKVVVE